MDAVDVKPKASVMHSQLTLAGVAVAKLMMALYMTVFLARILGPGEFGFVALVNTLFIVGRDLLDLGTGNVAAREIARQPQTEKTVLACLLVWRLMVGIVLALFCLGFAIQQPDAYRAGVFYACAAVMCLMYLSAYNTVFQVRQAHGLPSLLDGFSQLLLLAAFWLVYRLHADSGLYPLLLAIREAVLVLGKKYMANRLLGYNAQVVLHRKAFRDFFAKAAHFAGAALVYNTYFHSGTFWVWLLRPAEELGAYAAAFRPICPLLLFPWLMMVPLVSVLGKMARPGGSGFAGHVKAMLWLAAGIGCVGAVSGFVLADSLLGLLYGGKFIAGGLSAIAAFRVLAIAFGFACITPVFAVALLAQGQENRLLKMALTGLVANVSGNCLLVPYFGFLGAALSTLLTEALVCLLGIVLMAPSLKPLPIRSAVACLACTTALLAFVLQNLPGMALSKITLGGAIGLMAVYAIWRGKPAGPLRATCVLAPNLSKSV